MRCMYDQNLSQHSLAYLFSWTEARSTRTCCPCWWVFSHLAFVMDENMASIKWVTKMIVAETSDVDICEARLPLRDLPFSVIPSDVFRWPLHASVNQGCPKISKCSICPLFLSMLRCSSRCLNCCSWLLLHHMVRCT